MFARKLHLTLALIDLFAPFSITHPKESQQFNFDLFNMFLEISFSFFFSPLMYYAKCKSQSTDVILNFDAIFCYI